MPVPAVIAAAAQNYAYNNDFLIRSVEDLSPDEWLKAPAANMNHMAWIVGHNIWARKALVSRFGSDWTQPWLSLFARGAKLDQNTTYPSPETFISAWRESADVLATVLDNVSDEVLAQPAKNGPPSADGKMSGIVNFLALHETYHLGQASYLRSWLGKKGLMG